MSNKLSRIRVNATSKVDTKAIRREVRNGRDVVIVPSATMPANIVMNRVLYPEAAITASYATLERSPAPLGHPKLNGEYVSALDPEAQNLFGIGAWNENVRWEGGRVLLDKVIDVARAEASEGGKELLGRIERGEVVSTSTGLLADVQAVNADDHDQVATAIIFDHDAVLLDEDPAASPEQGVGMLVNGQKMPVFFVNIEEATSRELDWAGEEMVRTIRRDKERGVWSRIKDKVAAFMKSEIDKLDAEASTENQSAQTEVNTMDAEQAAALQADVAELKTSVADLAQIVKAMAEKQTANAEAEQAEARKEDETEIVNAGLATEDEAKAMPDEALKPLVNAARKLAANPKTAAPLLVNNGLDKAKPQLADHFV